MFSSTGSDLGAPVIPVYNPFSIALISPRSELLTPKAEVPTVSARSGSSLSLAPLPLSLAHPRPPVALVCICRCRSRRRQEGQTSRSPARGREYHRRDFSLRRFDFFKLVSF